MKKKGYYEYGNGIYPLKLWVHIGKDLKELIDSCFDKCRNILTWNTAASPQPT